jgi:hypothetical protein
MSFKNFSSLKKFATVLEFKFESGEEREIAKKLGQMVTGFVPGN